MAGEILGTDVIVQKGAIPADIVGQMEMSVSFSGTPIDISSKTAASPNSVSLLAGEVVGQQMIISGTLVYNSDTVYKAVRAAYLSGAHDTYSFGLGGTETFSAECQVTAMTDSLPHGDKVTTSITFSSSDAIQHVA